MASRKLDESPEITAQPRPISEELVSAPIAEPGLSVDPEDLGRQFLSEATEQGNFESSHGGESSEVNITDAALTDASLVGSAWDSGSVWEATVNMSLQSEGIDNARGDEPGESMPQDDEKMAAAEHELGDDMTDVNVTSSTIHNASLMDYETDELGGTASPNVTTDEQEVTERRRRSATQDLESTLPTGGVRPRSRAGRAASGAR